MNAGSSRPWLLGGLALLGAPVALWAMQGMGWGAPALDPIRAWLPVYFAGAAGGLVLELLKGQGRIELPSSSVAVQQVLENELDSDFAPFGPRIDIGVFSRLTMGAFAAVVFMILSASVVDGATVEQLAASAARVDTLAWAIAIGATSSAVWVALQEAVTSRANRFKARIAALNKITQGALNELAVTKQTIETIQTQLATPAEALIPGVKLMSLDLLANDLSKIEGQLTAARSIAGGSERLEPVPPVR